MRAQSKLDIQPKKESSAHASPVSKAYKMKPNSKKLTIFVKALQEKNDQIKITQTSSAKALAKKLPLISATKVVEKQAPKRKPISHQKLIFSSLIKPADCTPREPFMGKRC